MSDFPSPTEMAGAWAAFDDGFEKRRRAMVTKEDVDDDVPTYTPRTMRLVGEDMKRLADENDRLRAQIAEAVALLERSPMLYRCIAGSMGQDFCDSRDGAICSDHARRVFLAKLRGAP